MPKEFTLQHELPQGSRHKKFLAKSHLSRIALKLKLHGIYRLNIDLFHVGAAFSREKSLLLSHI